MVAIDVDLRKQSDYVKRYIKSDIQNYHQRGQVKNAVKILTPEQLNNVIQAATNALKGVDGESSNYVNKMDTPQLLTPRKVNLSGEAILTALLGAFVKLTDEVSLGKYILQVKNFNLSSSVAAEQFTSLATTLEAQAGQWANDTDSLKECKLQSMMLAQDVDKTKLSLDQMQKELNELEFNAAKQVQVSPEIQTQIECARGKVIEFQVKYNLALAGYNNYIASALNPAIDAESSSKSSLDATFASSQTLINTLSPQRQNAIEMQRKDNASDKKSLTFLMALIAQLIDKNATENLKAAAELKQKLSEAAAKEAKENAKEYDKQVKKAEHLHKAMGCVGKVLGWVITVASVVSAVFTGGASMVLAGIGLALTIGDEIEQAVNGKSFIQEAMNPVMDKIVKPLMDKLARSITDSLVKHQHTNKDKAEMVGQILGAILTASILIGAVFLCVKAGSKIGEKIMDKFGQRLMESSFVKMMQRLTPGLGKIIGADEVKIAKVINYAESALLATTLVNSAIQLGGNAVASNSSLEAAKARAQLIKSANVQDLLNQMMDIVVDNFTHMSLMVQKIIENMSTAAENQLNTGKYITGKMRNIAS